MQQNLLTVEQIAEKLSVPRSWIYSRTRQKGADRIPFLKCGIYCRFDFDQVLAWLQKNNKDDE